MRAHEPRDAEALYRLNSNPQVLRLAHEPPMPSVEAAREGIETYPDWDAHGFGRWACVLRSAGEDSAPIGFCGLKYLDDLGEIDIGYRFLPEYWGRGLATEAGLATLAFGFETLDLETIVAYVLPENAASRRVLTKLGLRRDGERMFDGRLAFRWSVTAAQWAARARG